MSTHSQRGGGGGVVGAIRTDLQRLHGAWMELVFPRQRGRGHSVMGKWQPETLPQKLAYYCWSAFGTVGLLVVYPLTVIGFATRFYAAKLDSTQTRLGIVGVTGVAVVVWGALTVLAHIQLPFEEFLAVAAASGAAIVAAALAATFSRVGGRGTSVVLAYPFAMTAIFLPPVVAALVTPALQPYVLDPSYEFAVWLLNNVLVVFDINEFLWDNFSLEGGAYAAMWVGISFPLGWFLGVLVALANLVRPSN
ncbi:hypothetical protein ACLI4Z_15295 [Natrialbaceae archaeon A-arb3/5]